MPRVRKKQKSGKHNCPKDLPTIVEEPQSSPSTPVNATATTLQVENTTPKSSLIHVEISDPDYSSQDGWFDSKFTFYQLLCLFIRLV